VDSQPHDLGAERHRGEPRAYRVRPSGAPRLPGAARELARRLERARKRRAAAPRPHRRQWPGAACGRCRRRGARRYRERPHRNRVIEGVTMSKLIAAAIAALFVLSPAQAQTPASKAKEEASESRAEKKAERAAKKAERKAKKAERKAKAKAERAEDKMERK